MLYIPTSGEASLLCPPQQPLVHADGELAAFGNNDVKRLLPSRAKS